MSRDVRKNMLVIVVTITSNIPRPNWWTDGGASHLRIDLDDTCCSPLWLRRGARASSVPWETDVRWAPLRLVVIDSGFHGPPQRR